MILADTSVWVDHLRAGDEVLARRLDEGRILGHPFVVGELALGNLKNRDVVLDALQSLPQPQIANDDEVMRMISGRRLWGRGIGLVDAHLLAAVMITPDAVLWTRDLGLAAIARDLGLASEP